MTIPRRKRALIVQGGYPGHRPREMADIVAKILESEHFIVEIYDTLQVFDDRNKLMQADLIVPLWTAGKIEAEPLNNLLQAVAAGTGLAGIHGSADAFRGEIQYQAMIGGQFLAHPGDDTAMYRIHFPNPHNPLVAGIQDFYVTTEQYYMMVDPSVVALATTYFDRPAPPLVWRPVIMPASWVKQYGAGRIYYNSLGHRPDVIQLPQVTEMIRRGMLWAAKG
ncbi:ThuA domain-containing protein [Paenibacillus sp. MMS18-CY102]|uniref:ThuA domain-containing protein n=1 Tax=Paenibacillus sp. MMS18-CY102 TaxID=2682849 RepID=UPI0013656EAD|nr:hypothetical protein [Paenibacillus sp. MMS18-CY102]